MSKAVQIQREYYKKTALKYDKMHVSDADEHGSALNWVVSICKTNKVERVLDVGCGTGRALFKLKEAGFQVMGIEPSESLLEIALEKGAAKDEVILASGEKIPLSDSCVEAVCEFGVLHHVENPNLVLEEMMRVASKFIFISDSNRFGQGAYFMRWIKLLIYKAGFWPIVNWVRTAGKNYMISEGDGLFYSYSVYDSLKLLAPWAKQIYLIPTRDEGVKGWLHPLLTASHVLLVAVKK